MIQHIIFIRFWLLIRDRFYYDCHYSGASVGSLVFLSCTLYVIFQMTCCFTAFCFIFRFIKYPPKFITTRAFYNLLVPSIIVYHSTGQLNCCTHEPLNSRGSHCIFSSHQFQFTISLTSQLQQCLDPI